MKKKSKVKPEEKKDIENLNKRRNTVKIYFVIKIVSQESQHYK